MSEFVQRPVEGQRKALERLTGRKIRVKKDGQNQACTFNYLRRYITRGGNRSGQTLCGLVAIIIQEMLWDLSLSWKMWYYVDWLRKSRIAFNFEQSSNKSYASFSKLFSLKNEKCFTAD